MKKVIVLSAAALLALCTLPVAYAQCCPGGKNKGEAKAAKLAGDQAGCSKDAKLAHAKDGPASCDPAACCHKSGGKDGGDCLTRRLAAAGAPLMTYKVGDDGVRCPEKAATLAKEKNAEIRYVVGDKTFTNKDEAVKAYAAALDGYVATMTTVRYAVGDECVSCPQTAAELARQNNTTVRYRVAAMTFDSESKAEAAARAARTAVEKVTLKADKKGECAKSCGSKDAVASCGDKSSVKTAKATCDKPCDKPCDTDKGGERMAKAPGCGQIGDGCCPETNAALSLALARIEAAQRAIAKAAGAQTAASDRTASGA